MIVTTAYGFAFEADESEDLAQHVKGFDTIAEAKKAVTKKRLQRCSCGRCTRGPSHVRKGKPHPITVIR